MKEFRSKNSGRYIFNEDIHNLQELALSPVEMYKDSGLDFVLSGCVISITEQNGIYSVGITSGYVFLDNRIRKVAAFSGTTSSINTIGIYATEPVAPQITYRNGDTDYMYDDYEAEFRVNYNNIGNISNLQAAYNGNKYVFPNLRTAYFAHYALVNDGTPGHYPLIQGDRVVGTMGEFANIKIGNSSISSLFVSRSGDTMETGATLLFGSTIIGENSIVVDGDFQAENGLFNGDVTIDGDVVAASFAKKNGTSSQFLKADGSVDTTNYATNASLTNYLLLSGGTINGDLAVNENLQVNKNCIISRDLTIQGQINAVGGTLTGNLEVLGLKASNAEVTNILEVGGLDVSGIGNVDGTLDVGGAFTTQSVATIGGDTIINGQITSTKFVRVNGTSSQFLKANGDVDGNTYALASSLNNYLLKAGGIITGNLTCNAKITANSFVKADGTATQFLKADGSIDANTYATVSQLSSYAQASSLSNYLQLIGGTLTGSITAPSFIRNGGTSSQFLKADGSVDNNTYLPLSGGTMLGNIIAPSFIKVGGTSGQFLKADGSVDSNSYPPLNQNGGIEIVEAKISDELIIGISGYRTMISSDDSGCNFNGANIGYNFDAGINAPAFYKNGGLSTQFLKADGSIDSHNYVPFSANNTIDINKIIVEGELVIGNGDYCVATISTDQDGCCFTGGRPGYHFDNPINASRFIKYAGLSTQFLKADGSVDDNSYVPLLPNNTIEISRINAVEQLAIGSISYRTTIVSDDGNCRFRGANHEYDFDEKIIAPAFQKENGTSSQFLKADGSVDNNSYVPLQPNNTIEISRINVLNKLEIGSEQYATTIMSDDSGCKFTGGNLDYIFDANVVAASFVKEGGTSNQFLKADGSIDNNSYLPLSGGTLSNSGCTLNISPTSIRLISPENYYGRSGGIFIEGNATDNQLITVKNAPDDEGDYDGVLIAPLSVSLRSGDGNTIVLRGDTGTIAGSYLKELGDVKQTSISQIVNFFDTLENNHKIRISTGVDSNNEESYTEILAGSITVQNLDSNNRVRISGMGIESTSLISAESIKASTLCDANGNEAYVDDIVSFFTGSSQYDFGRQIVATAFIKENGTSSQFLKADGSVDNNSYVPIVNGSIAINEATIDSRLRIGDPDYRTTITSDDTGCHFTRANINYTFDTDVDVEGSVTARSFPTSSDSRLKNQMGGALLTAEQIADAPSIKFTWNDDDDDRVFVGSIAQYWQKVLPEVVEEKNGFLALNYGTTAMISVINLAKEVVALKKEIEQLKSQI